MGGWGLLEKTRPVPRFFVKDCRCESRVTPKSLVLSTGFRIFPWKDRDSSLYFVHKLPGSNQQKLSFLRVDQKIVLTAPSCYSVEVFLDAVSISFRGKDKSTFESSTNASKRQSLGA